MEILDTLKISKEEIINKTIQVLSQGGIVIYPTETTYGIGVDAENQLAVDKLLQYKGRREGKPFSVAVTDYDMATRYVTVNKTAQNIYSNFLPGPVTVISQSKNIVAKGVASETGTLGIRIPNYSLILDIIHAYNKGITATSANQSQGKAPYSISDILENISAKQKSLIDLILDAGELPRNPPSTVIDTVSGNIETIRSGSYRFDLNKSITSKTVEYTINLGKELGKQILKDLKERPCVIAIQGDLGAGKTHFASGVAKGLGIQQMIKSPTFILCNEYNFQINTENKKNLTYYHIDTYRMNNESDLLNIGFQDMISEPNIILIEWADRVLPILEKFKDQCNFIWLRFDYIDENTRIINHNMVNFS